MPQQSERPAPHGDPVEEELRDANPEPNTAQRNTDAPPDAVAELGHEGESVTVEPLDGVRSTANGIPASAEEAGEIRKKLYRDGATLVSRID